MRAFLVAALLSCVGGCATQPAAVSATKSPAVDPSEPPAPPPEVVLATLLAAHADGSLVPAQCEELAALSDEVGLKLERSVDRFNVAVLRHRCADTDGARRLYASIGCDDPEFAAALNNNGVLAHEEGRTSEARRWFSLALRYEPSLSSAQRNIGRSETREFAESGDFEAFYAAESEFQSLLASNPRDIGAREGLARLYYSRARRGDRSYATLAEFIIREHTQGPDEHPTAELLNLRGLVALEGGDSLRALRAFRHAIDAEPRAVAPRVNAALVLVEARAFEPALEHLEAVSDAATGTLAVDVFLSIGNAKLGLWQFVAAEDAYEHAKALDPTDPRADFNLGLLNLIRSGRVDSSGIDEVKSARLHFETFISSAEFDTRSGVAVARAKDALVAIDQWLDEPTSCRIEPEARRLEELQRLQEAQERRRLLELERKAKAALEANPTR